MKGLMQYDQASFIAEKLAEKFSAHCERIEVAGSLRRKKLSIGDIELIAIPKHSLYELLDDLLKDGNIRHTGHKRRGGKLRSFVFDLNSGQPVQVDMFLQSPEAWGVNMVIRTGCSEFSRRMVTAKNRGGWMPAKYKVKDARLWCKGVALPTPEEVDVFRLYGMEYVRPEARVAGYQPKIGDVPSVDVAEYEPEPEPVAVQTGLF